MNRALFLDRDGVVNVDTGYLHRVEDCVFVDGIFDTVRQFHRLGFKIIIATNQAGIGRGYYGAADFERLMTWMREQFEGRITAVYHCPDHPDGIGVYRRDNPWRKPGAGMLLQAAQDFDLALPWSWTIGDKQTDVGARCRPISGTSSCSTRRDRRWNAKPGTGSSESRRRDIVAAKASSLILLCQTKILVLDHVGKYNVVC